jgi:hypothetical protein
MQIATNEALHRRASERPLVGCYAELGRVWISGAHNDEPSVLRVQRRIAPMMT